MPLAPSASSILHSLLAELQVEPPPEVPSQEQPPPPLWPAHGMPPQPKTPHSLAAPGSTSGRVPPHTAAAATPSCPAPQHVQQQPAPGGASSRGQPHHMQPFKTPLAALPQPPSTSGGTHAPPSASHSSASSSRSSIDIAGLRPRHTSASASQPTPPFRTHPCGVSPLPFESLAPSQPHALQLAAGQASGGSGGGAPHGCNPEPRAAMVAPPLAAAVSSRTLHSLSSSEDDPMFHKGGLRVPFEPRARRHVHRCAP